MTRRPRFRSSRRLTSTRWRPKGFFSGRVIRRRDAFERGLTYNVEFASDLASPAWTSQGVTQTGVGVVNADFESVTNCVPITPGSGFLRLNVSLDP
jgi:hypothetical protein